MNTRRQFLTIIATGGSAAFAGCNFNKPSSDDYTYQITILNGTRDEQQVRLEATFPGEQGISKDYVIPGRGAVSTIAYDSPPGEIIVGVTGRGNVQFKYSSRQECPGQNANITFLIEKTEIVGAGSCGEVHEIDPKTPSETAGINNG